MEPGAGLSSNVYSKDLSIPVSLGASAKPRGCAHAPHQNHHLRDPLGQLPRYDFTAVPHRDVLSYVLLQ
jgi:hypothetical protein